MDVGVPAYRLKERRSFSTESHLASPSQRLRWVTNTLRTWGFCFVIFGFACTRALACPMPTLQQTILFDHVLSDLDAPVIAEVIILDREADVIDPFNHVQMAVM